MNENISVSQAAAILKLTNSRIRQLCRSKVIRAEKLSGVWLIHSPSLKLAAKRPPVGWPKGRARKAAAGKAT